MSEGFQLSIISILFFLGWCAPVDGDHDRPNVDERRVLSGPAEATLVVLSRQIYQRDGACTQVQRQGDCSLVVILSEVGLLIRSAQTLRSHMIFYRIK